MKKAMLVVVVVSLLIGLFGCVWFDQPEGIVRIAINPSTVMTQAVQPKTIPVNATHIRVRIWHNASPVNIVKTMELQTGPLIASITLPAKAGYIVDVVSYTPEGYLLTGDRAMGVNVTAGGTTDVSLVLAPWNSGCSGDTACEALAAFGMSFNLSGGGGLVLDCFDAVYLSGSYTSFQDPGASVATLPLATGDISNGQVNLTATMPATDIEATFYSMGIAHVINEWIDLESPSGAIYLNVELPNRHMGETIHETLVTPPSGGVDITIE